MQQDPRAGSTSRTQPQNRAWLHGKEALALHLLARELAGAADGFRGLPGPLFGGLLVVISQLHLAKDTFALQLLLKSLESLIDVVVAHENLQA
jgi:hypothetical protein